MRPGIIRFAALDLGQDPPRYDCPIVPSKPERYYPSLYINGSDKPIDLPDEGEATVKFRVNNRETSRRGGKTRYSAGLEILSIDPDKKEKPKLKTAARRIALSAMEPGVIEFADTRPRNGNGQYVANETGGVDPNSMAAAYGPVQAQKAQKQNSLIARFKAMLGTQPV